MRLCLLGCTYGAGSCTRTAVDAAFCVDNILAVALGNSVYGAITCTSTAADALVTDGVSHFKLLL